MHRNDMPWVLVLSDGKPGHRNQSLGVIPAGIEARQFQLEYRSAWCRGRVWGAARVPLLAVLLAGRFPWGGLIRNGEALAQQVADAPVVVLSTGSGPAPVTLMLARHLGCPAVTCMTPSVGLSRVDLALVPRHDNPPASARVVTTIGAPNLVDPQRMDAEGQAFRQRHGLAEGPFLVLLLGGDSAHHVIGPESGRAILDACLSLGGALNLEVLVTTSRRTRRETEDIMAERVDECAYFCRGRSDTERVVPGMLALAQLVVVTEDSVSMVSEAASSEARVLALGVARKGGIARRHEAVLTTLAEEGFVVRTVDDRLEADGMALMGTAPPPVLDDTAQCRAALARLIGEVS